MQVEQTLFGFFSPEPKPGRGDFGALLHRAAIATAKSTATCPPGRGVIKFEPYLQAIKELDINGTVAIELEYSPDPSHIVEWVEEAYRETARLMDLLGLRG
jgi:sugar phosphate isomerase/epimerase